LPESENPDQAFDTKQQAQQWVRRVEGEMDSGAYLDRSESELTTLREALERYRRDNVPLYYRREGSRPI